MKLVVLRPAFGLVRALEWPLLVYVGAVSYGVYLLHKLVLHVVSRGFDASALNAPGLQFAAVLAGMVSVAALSFRYFETPSLALKARFR